MSKQNRKTREVIIYFTPVYNVIIQNWFLDPIERSLAVLFSSQPNGESILSREVLKKHCRCGHYHLERALKRLEFMKIIKIDRGGWKQRNPPVREPNRYIFDYDPYNWRVPKDVQDKIVNETKALKKEPRPFVNGGFPNQLGMDIVFKEAVPVYAEGRKPRDKKARESKVREPDAMLSSLVSNDDQKWIRKSQKITADDVRFTYLASEYYRYFEDLKSVYEYPDHGFSEHQLTYFERLSYLFAERKKLLRDKEDIEVLNKISLWLSENRSSLEISNELGRINQLLRSSEQGGTNSTPRKES